MTYIKQFVTLIILQSYFLACLALPTRIYHEKCNYKGFTCPLSPIFPSRYDIVFECNQLTTQDVQFYLWQFSSPSSIASLTIQRCDRVQISFTCTADNRPIQWLRIKDVGVLEIITTTSVTHNPPEIYLENISYINTIPANTFSQIKYAPNKAGCFVPMNDTNSIYFKNVNIGTIQSGAFNNLILMKKLSWSNVSVNRIESRAVNVSFENEKGCAELKSCHIGVLAPLALMVNAADVFTITRGVFDDIWTSAINGTIYDFDFSHNTVKNIQSGAISILSQNVFITNNKFKKVESGSFRKISPGLVHDSRRSFDDLKFTYSFNNNWLGHVEDGSFSPDIVSYKNVNANICYTYNTMPCSCEGLAWLRDDDVELGQRYSVIKEFNSKLLDPENSNLCSFTPCMCLGRSSTCQIESESVVMSPNATTPKTLITVKSDLK